MILLSGCGMEPVDPVKERAERVKDQRGDIVIGVSYPFGADEDLFEQGALAARDDINASGGVLGRKVRLVLKDDAASVEKGLAIAREFSKDKGMTAVIGHGSSVVSISCASIYENDGLIMICPASTSVQLARPDQHFIFQSIPDDNATGIRLAQYAARKGYKDIAILYEDNDYGFDVANAFEKESEVKGLNILDRWAYSGNDDTLALLVEKWNLLGIDAVLVVDTGMEGIQLIRKCKTMNLTVPVLCSDGLDTPKLISNLGSAAEGIVVASPCDTDLIKKNQPAFYQSFQRKYGKAPDAWAIQSYDAILILVHAISDAGTASPPEVVQALKSKNGFPGMAGQYRFSGAGQLLERTMALKTVQNGQFRYIP